MKPKRFAVFLSLAALALLSSVGATGCGAGRTPAGQAPLFTLAESNFGEFESAFDAGGGPHLVVLLSPT